MSLKVYAAGAGRGGSITVVLVCLSLNAPRREKVYYFEIFQYAE
jgi:hypothetical protein